MQLNNPFNVKCVRYLQEEVRVTQNQLEKEKEETVDASTIHASRGRRVANQQGRQKSGQCDPIPDVNRTSLETERMVFP